MPVAEVKNISVQTFIFFSLTSIASGTVYLPRWNAHNTFQIWRFSWKLVQWKSYFSRSKSSKWTPCKHNIYGEWDHYTWHNWIKYERNWWFGHGGCMEIINAYKILLEKSEVMTNFGRARWEGEIKTTYKDTVCEDVNCKTFVSKQARKGSYDATNILVP